MVGAIQEGIIIILIKTEILMEIWAGGFAAKTASLREEQQWQEF